MPNKEYAPDGDWLKVDARLEKAYEQIPAGPDSLEIRINRREIRRLIRKRAKELYPPLNCHTIETRVVTVRKSRERE